MQPMQGNLMDCVLALLKPSAFLSAAVYYTASGISVTVSNSGPLGLYITTRVDAQCAMRSEI